MNTGARMLSLLLLVSQAGAQSELGADFRRSYTAHATRLRADLFGNGYDPTVPPVSVRNPAQPYVSEAGTDVNMQIRFFKVESIKAAEGSMRIKIWYRQNWVDERLAWNSSEYGGITQFWANSVSGEPSIEPWVPDLTPYNLREGLGATLDPANAIIYSNGGVFYSRPGIIDVMCKFAGLAAFPFDELTCGIEVGGWIHGGGHQGITLMGDGYAFSSQEITAGSSYQEYSIKNVNATVNLYTYACCPSDPYPVVNYVITVQRAGVFYVLMFIVPSLLLTMLSFSVFFMSFEVGERLGFGITLVLTFEVTKTIVMEFVPVCGEVLWIDLFLMVNEYFAILALLESWLVLFLAYHSDDHIIPSLFLPPASFISAVSWWLGMPPPSKRLREGSACSVASELVRAFKDATPPNGKGPSSPPPSPPESGIYETSGHDSAEDAAVAADAELSKSLSSRRKRRSSTKDPSKTGPDMSACLPGDAPPSSPPFRLRNKLDPEATAGYQDSAYNFGMMVQQRPLTTADFMKFVFFEKLFYLIDNDSNGYVTLIEMDKLLQFLALELDEGARMHMLLTLDDESDGLVQKDEFVQACVILLWNVSQSQLTWASNNYIEAATTKDERNTFYWQKAAKQVDRLARVWICSIYFLVLVYFWALVMSDNYDKAPEEGEPEMYAGIGPHYLHVSFIIAPIVVVILVMVVVYQSGLHYMEGRKRRKAMNERVAQAKAKAKEHALEIGEYGHTSLERATLPREHL